MADVTLRKMTKDDRDIFFGMSREFYTCGAAHENIPDSYRERFWKDVLDGKFICGYMIVCDGNTAGYALVAYYASQEYGGKIALFDELFIKPEFRGSGIGTKVFEFVEKSGIVACRLEVEPTNTRAINLYRALGYKEFGYIQMSKKIK